MEIEIRRALRITTCSSRYTQLIGGRFFPFPALLAGRKPWGGFIRVPWFLGCIESFSRKDYPAVMVTPAKNAGLLPTCSVCFPRPAPVHACESRLYLLLILRFPRLYWQGPPPSMASGFFRMLPPLNCV